MKIMKFGGAVLTDSEGFGKMLSILANFKERPLLVVISAIGKTTRALQETAFLSETGSIQKANSKLSELIEDFQSFTTSIINSSLVSESLHHYLKEVKSRLSSYLNSIYITSELSSRTLDTFLSFGEEITLKIAYSYLSENGLNISVIDSKSMISTDNNFGNAKPDLEKTKEKVEKILKPELDKNNLILTQGFVARTLNGDISTMGIESSNLTAAIYAGLLNCEELIVWTNVEGIRSADPIIVADTIPIKKIDRQSALRASKNGLKLIYPSMLYFAEDYDFKITFRSALNPDGDFTTIDSSNDNPANPMIIHQPDLSYFYSPNNSKISSEKFSDIKDNIIWSNYSNDSIGVLIHKNASIETKKIFSSFSEVDDVVLITILNITGIKKRVFELLSKSVVSTAIKMIAYSEFGDQIKFLVPKSIATSVIRLMHQNLIEKMDSTFEVESI